MARALFELSGSLVDDKVVRSIVTLAPACRALAGAGADLGRGARCRTCACTPFVVGTISLVAGWPAVGLCRATQQTGTSLAPGIRRGPVP